MAGVLFDWIGDVDLHPNELMIVSLLVAVLGTAIGGLLAREFSALLSQLNRAVLDRHLRRLAARGADRRRERIEVDFEAYAERPVAGLLFTMRLRWTAHRPLLRSALSSLSELAGNAIDHLMEGGKGGRLPKRPLAPVSMAPAVAGLMVGWEMERLRQEGRADRADCGTSD